MPSSRRRCGVCGKALRWGPISQSYLHNSLEDDRNHKAVLAAPSEREQARLEAQHQIDYGPHGPECDCQDCEHAILVALGIRHGSARLDRYEMAER